MVKVMGDFTFVTVPGLKCHLRKAATAALSRMRFPVLRSITALVTLPAGSIVIATTPVPVTFCRLASYGYSGRGALRAMTLAWEILSEPEDCPILVFTMGTAGLLG